MSVDGILLCMVMEFETGNEPYRGELFETFISREFYPIWEEAGLVGDLYPNQDNKTEVQMIRKRFVNALVDMHLRKKDYMNVVRLPAQDFLRMDGQEAEAYRDRKLSEAMWKIAQLLLWMDKYPMAHFELRE